MSHIEYRILDRPMTYSGTELRPHWGLEQTGVYGSLIVSFIGPCFVNTENLVDWEDKLKQDFIRSKQMLHFIGEFFGTPLETAVLYQRLFMVWAEKLLVSKGFLVIREGDDLFFVRKNTERFKMSVSIATISSVSSLIHWGINIEAHGSPVPAIGLGDLGWSDAQVLGFAKEVLERYISELEEIRRAQFKVKPVTSYFESPTSDRTSK